MREKEEEEEGGTPLLCVKRKCKSALYKIPIRWFDCPIKCMACKAQSGVSVIRPCPFFLRRGINIYRPPAYAAGRLNFQIIKRSTDAV